MPAYNVQMFVIARVAIEKAVTACSQEEALAHVMDTIDFGAALASGPARTPGVESVCFSGGIDSAHVSIVGDDEKLFDRYYRSDAGGEWQILTSEVAAPVPPHHPVA